MKTLNELYSVPYHVLANPSKSNSVFDPFIQIFNDLKGAWDEFGKTGYMDPLKQHLQIAWDVTQQGTVDYLALTKASISFIGLIPGAGAVVPFINMFVDFIFPKLFGRGSQQNAQAQFFEIIIEKVKEIVDQEFRDFSINNLLNYLDGMQTTLAHFQNDVQIAICQGEKPGLMLDGTPVPCTPTKDHLVSVRESFKDARSAIEIALPHFKNPMLSTNDNTQGFNSDTVLLTLPMYTTAATLNLILHQGYIQFVEKWKSVDYDEGFINQIKVDLQKRIQEYSDTVYTNFEKFKPNLDYSNKKSINTYNRYVRSMTLQSLDIAATWPTLDNANYPPNIEIQLDQTRLIFSDIAGPWEGNENIVANVIDVLNPVNTGIGFQERSDLRTFVYPRLELQGVQFHNYHVTTPGVSGVEHCYSDGLKLSFNDNRVISAGQSNTDTSKPKDQHYYSDIIQSPMTDINVYSQNTQYLDFSNIRVNNGLSVAGCAPWSSTNQKRSTNEALSGQKINIIYPVQSNDKPESHADTAKKWGYMSSHIPYDLVPENIIGDINPDTKLPVLMLKGFPFAKYSAEYINQGISLVSEWINGNNAVRLSTNQSVGIQITNQTKQKYQIRCRYASNDDIDVFFNVDTGGANPIFQQIKFESTKTGKMGVQGVHGVYVVKSITTADNLIELPTGNFSIHVTNRGSSDLFLDRIEFINREDSSRETNPKFESKNDLKNITNQVNSLFVSNAQDILAKDVSDYRIEQVVMKVDALSDEVFGKEKKALRTLVNIAKRLSKARNLLVGGNFDKLDAWYRGRNVVNVSNHELFKSDHVLLPPPTLYPSYIFQKVKETKLKANTRYIVSGFIAHAEYLEIIVSRYGQEVQKVVQVPYGEAFPLTSSGSICCPSRSTTNGKQANPHFFSYSIDVGELDMEAGPGIELGLRIVERTGMARVSNLEIRENRPLTTNEIRKVQRVARDWKLAYDQGRAEILTLIQPVLNQVNALYKNEDWNGFIRSGISYRDLEAIVFPELGILNHWFMSDILGEQSTLLVQAQEALNRAYKQLEQSTLLHNGHFTTDAENWTAEGDTEQITLSDGRRVLRLSDWSSSMSQTIEIENFDPDQEYQLNIHAQGKGAVTLQHGEAGKNVDVHVHDTNSFTKSVSNPVTFETNKVKVEITSEEGEFLVDYITLIELPISINERSSDKNTAFPTTISNKSFSATSPLGYEKKSRCGCRKKS